MMIHFSAKPFSCKICITHVIHTCKCVLYKSHIMNVYKQLRLYSSKSYFEYLQYKPQCLHENSLLGVRTSMLFINQLHMLSWIIASYGYLENCLHFRFLFLTKMSNYAYVLIRMFIWQILRMSTHRQACMFIFSYVTEYE